MREVKGSQELSKLQMVVDTVFYGPLILFIKEQLIWKHYLCKPRITTSYFENKRVHSHITVKGKPGIRHDDLRLPLVTAAVARTGTAAQEGAPLCYIYSNHFHWKEL